MNTNQKYEIDNASISIDSIYLVTDLKKKYVVPLKFKEPAGIYTNDPEALYAGKVYKMAIKVDGIRLEGMDNTYTLKIKNGYLLSQPVFNDALGMLVFDIKFDAMEIPALDVYSLVESLWKMCGVYLTINGQDITAKDKSILQIPLAFNTDYVTPTGDAFYNSNKAFMVVQPGERLFLDLVSGSGGGSGVNLIKGENKSGEHGGDATLCYIDPIDGEVKPIVFIEGGYGGRLSTHAHQEFKDRECKSKVFVEGQLNTYTFIEVISKCHNQPERGVTEVGGGCSHVCMDGSLHAAGGCGGIKDEIGFRGEGGVSGGRMIVQIRHSPDYFGTPGPFIVLHPKTMVNVFGVVKDKGLKVKKTKTPMIAGKGGESLTQPGGDGQDGTMIVSI